MLFDIYNYMFVLDGYDIESQIKPTKAINVKEIFKSYVENLTFLSRNKINCYCFRSSNGRSSKKQKHRTFSSP